MIVRYVGPVLDHSGYGAAARGDVLALLSAGVSVYLEPVRFGPPAPPHQRFDAVWRKLLACPPRWDIEIVRATPDTWRRFLSGRVPAVGCTVWETTAIPASWADAIMGSGVRETWTPSVASRDALLATLPAARVRVVPHAVDLETCDGVSVPPREDGETRFCASFQWTSRKGPDVLLLAYFAAFSRADRVRLVLHVHDTDDAVARVRAVQAGMNLRDEDTPRVSLSTGRLSQGQMFGMYKACDWYVSPHRGEGWGLSLVDALAAGLPVIATGWGGPLDYLPRYTPLLDYEMQPVYGTWDHYHARRGGVSQEWAEPSVACLRGLLRSAADRGLVSPPPAAMRAAVEPLDIPAVGARMLAALEAITEDGA